MPVLAPSPPLAPASPAATVVAPARQLRLTECPACAAADRAALGAGEVLCEACAGELIATCRDCGLLTTGGTVSPSGLVVCPQCLPYHDVCDHCPELLPIGWRRCGYCADDWVDGLPIHPGDYRPTPIFHGRGPLFLGVELELWTNTRLRAAAELTVRRLGALGYLKADSSLGGRGFEIVTHPMDYRFARTRFPWRLLDELRELGCFTTTETGLHIHLSRAGFDSPAHIYRWLVFLYRNETQVTALARRRSRFAQFDSASRARLHAYAAGDRGDIYRGRAVNVCYDDTFELRIFTSTLDPRRAQAALAFAAASVAYTAELTPAAVVLRDGWSWTSFTAWLAAQPGYGVLREEIATITALHR